MPAVNFKARFAMRVALGFKRTTIRRGARFKVGDRFYGYFGMRTKRCVQLAEGRVIAADDIVIVRGAATVAGRMLTLGEGHALAVGDGFQSMIEFCACFAEEYALPFTGQLAQWEPELGTLDVQQARYERVSAALLNLGGGKP